MASRPRLQELEPISPELVLVSPPEVARRAREELREPAFLRDTGSAVRERPTEQPPRVDVAEPAPSRRRWRRLALVAAAVGVVAAAAVALLFVTRDNSGRRANRSVAVAGAGAAEPSTTPGAGSTQRSTTATTRAVHAQSRNPKRAHKRKQTRPRAAATRESVVGFVPARTWTWPKSKGARAYELRFLRNGRVVLHVRTTGPRLVLPSAFRFRAGAYRWLVLRVPAAANGRPIVDSKFVVTRAAAGRANR
jgi:hypothetical protein